MLPSNIWPFILCSEPEKTTWERVTDEAGSSFWKPWCHENLTRQGISPEVDWTFYFRSMWIKIVELFAERQFSLKHKIWRGRKMTSKESFCNSLSCGDKRGLQKKTDDESSPLWLCVMANKLDRYQNNWHTKQSARPGPAAQPLVWFTVSYLS